MDMETEDLMWKQIYNKLMETKKSEEEKTEHEIRIQEIDGGFFEKFGSLFRENAELAISREEEEKEDVANAAALATSAEESDVLPADTEIEADRISSSSDSESNETSDKTEIISTALNIDELYSEILYEIIHNIGCDLSCDIGQTALLSYVQDAFHVSNEYHQNMFNAAEQKEAPKILLNVEVIEAKDLAPKDSNGLSDPFVTLYLTSNPAHKYNTSMKEGTLCPLWEEHFALPWTDNALDDTLCLEVWDFDPAESVKEKFGKIFDVKGVKGVRKLMKEIAVTAAHGQHENELIGKARVPLNTIPAAGMTMWYSLDKKNKDTKQGIIKVRISFSSKKNTLVAQQEHRHLLRILLLHELETSKVAPHWWCGSFSQQGEAIITQHIIQSGLTQTEAAICQWAVYIKIHQNHALSFVLYSNLLDKLLKPLQSHNALSDEDIKLFWNSTRKLLPYCFSVIRKIKRKQADKNLVKSVNEVLTILSKIMMLEIPSDFNLFPSTLYPWIPDIEETNELTLKEVLLTAIKVSASNWYDYVVDNNKNSESTDTAKLQLINKVFNLVRCDLQKAIEFFDKSFYEKVGVAYAKELYILYQQKVSELTEDEVMNICKSLKKLNFTGNSLNEESHKEALEQGTKLFELYLGIQRFVVFGQGICPVDCDSFYINNFYKWFHGGVAQWLEIAVYKALQRIEKAVELDKLVPVDATVKYSSSAVDTLSIFYQVKVFWQQLNWPDVEGCYTFIAKMIDDICRCGVFYAQRMSKRVDGMGEIQNVYENRFEVTNEWCLSINNIEYVSQALKPFTTELGMEEVIKKLSDLKSPLEAQRCQQTLDNVIDNAVDTVKNEIFDLLETLILKMAPAMKRLLIEGAELFNQDSNSVDRLMLYVDNNLSTLHRELNEENFDRTIYMVWEQLGKILQEIIQASFENRRPPSFFANLHKTLNLMLGSFKTSDDCARCDGLIQAEQLLKVYGLETNDLIHQVNLDLHEEYKSNTESTYGVLTVRAKFQENVLYIEILNAKILVAMDSNGLCDAFVRVHLMPEDKFRNQEQPKTKTHNKTLVPLFDEVFEVKLSDEQRLMHNGLLLFSVKDKDLLGYNNKHIGEAFIHFRDIIDTEEPLSSLPQIHLQLSRPVNSDALTIKALEHRQGEKLAKEFLKKFRQRIGSNNPKANNQ
ncbi:protein unc-13 homolog 4B isoform X3 [Coccinella septempunctata]|uniref:protein unc-13 homolog 4B isoform X3 n=1 Tax=Coccinella septempunctata TaxID=41139 RepID=UPI001D07B49D|nr:protein unc-13 homolog 4B isoform X3 [Coccinella septempunctata]XP_044755921.1 protein unc-13 homolog 4B isoform X3 [Coccinella septempunctata]